MVMDGIRVLEAGGKSGDWAALPSLARKSGTGSPRSARAGSHWKSASAAPRRAVCRTPAKNSRDSGLRNSRAAASGEVAGLVGVAARAASALAQAIIMARVSVAGSAPHVDSAAISVGDAAPRRRRSRRDGRRTSCADRRRCACAAVCPPRARRSRRRGGSPAAGGGPEHQQRSRRAAMEPLGRRRRRRGDLAGPPSARPGPGRRQQEAGVPQRTFERAVHRPIVPANTVAARHGDGQVPRRRTGSPAHDPQPRHSSEQHQRDQQRARLQLHRQLRRRLWYGSKNAIGRPGKWRQAKLNSPKPTPAGWLGISVSVLAQTLKREPD